MLMVLGACSTVQETETTAKEELAFFDLTKGESVNTTTENLGEMNSFFSSLDSLFNFSNVLPFLKSQPNYDYIVVDRIVLLASINEMKILKDRLTSLENNQSLRKLPKNTESSKVNITLK